jgi:putative membrane protein
VFTLYDRQKQEGREMQQLKGSANGTEVLKGMAAGIVGGAVASVAMNQFQKLCSRVLLGGEKSHGAQSLQNGTPGYGASKMLEQHGAEDPTDDSAERLSQTISVGVFDHKLSEDAKDNAGTMFHYAYGMGMGAVYGAAAEIVPQTTAGAGVLYGALIWIGADEIVVPALGLSKPANGYPPSVIAAAFAAHLVYGFTLETVRSKVRGIM